MCSLRDAANDLSDLVGVDDGISADSPEAVKAFHSAQQLTFPLLPDPSGDVIRAYGVQREGANLANRVTFVIDPEGTVRFVEPKVTPQGHGRSLVETLKKLRGG